MIRTSLLAILLFTQIKIYGQGGCYTPVLEGKTVACIGGIYEYRISPASPISFSFSISSGGTILSVGPGSPSNYIATVQWHASGPQTVTATCGSYSSTLNVTVTNVSPPPATSSITGASVACQNSTTTYSVNNAPGYNYVWEVTRNGSIVNTQTLTLNGNSLDITWNESGSFKVISYLSNGSCVGPSQSIDVNVQKLPSLQISGSAYNSCVGGTSSFTAAGGGVGDTYFWSIDGGEQITSNGNTASVAWDSQGTFTISVYASNSCFGNGPIASISKTITPSLPPLGVISGPMTACTNIAQTFSVSPILGATSYSWTLPSFPLGATFPIITDYNSFHPAFKFITPGNYTITVVASNQNCITNSQSISINVAPNSNTVQLGGLQGPNSICLNGSAVFTALGDPINGVPVGTAFSWWGGDGITISNVTNVPATIPTAPPITTYNSQATIGSSSSGTRYIAVNYTTPGGCTSPSSSINTFFDDPQIPTISGNQFPSCGSTTIYSTESGMSNYQWVVPSGGTVVSGGTVADHTVSIQWGDSSPQNIMVNYTNPNGCTPSVPGNITISPSKVSQSVAFPPFQPTEYGHLPISLPALSNFGLPVIYSSSNSSVAAVSGNLVTIVGAGTATITATQAGDNCTLPITGTSQSLIVDKGNQTITFPVLSSKNYNDAPFLLTATASSGLALSYSSSNPNVITISGNTATITGTGTTTITASQDGNSNYYAAAPVNQIFGYQPSDSNNYLFTSSNEDFWRSNVCTLSNL